MWLQLLIYIGWLNQSNFKHMCNCPNHRELQAYMWLDANYRDNRFQASSSSPGGIRLVVISGLSLRGVATSLLSPSDFWTVNALISISSCLRDSAIFWASSARISSLCLIITKAMVVAKAAKLAFKMNSVRNPWLYPSKSCWRTSIVTLNWAFERRVGSAVISCRRLWDSPMERAREMRPLFLASINCCSLDRIR